MEIEGLRNQIRDNVRITIDPKIFLAEGESEDEMPATVNIDQSIDIIVTGKKEAFNAIATVNDELALQGKAAPTVEKALQALLETSAELLGYYIEKLDDSHLQLPATGGRVAVQFFRQVKDGAGA
ncbi:hypothetical protein Q7P37_011053 [Cladosporium fusiforme]